MLSCRVHTARHKGFSSLRAVSQLPKCLQGTLAEELSAQSYVYANLYVSKSLLFGAGLVFDVLVHSTRVRCLLLGFFKITVTKAVPMPSQTTQTMLISIYIMAKTKIVKETIRNARKASQADQLEHFE